MGGDEAGRIEASCCGCAGGYVPHRCNGAALAVRCVDGEQQGCADAAIRGLSFLCGCYIYTSCRSLLAMRAVSYM